MKKPPRPTEKKRGKRADLEAWLARARPSEIGETEFDELRRALAPISESYMRRLLRDSGVILAPMVAGVRQASLDALETSLLALQREYDEGDALRRDRVRRIVIGAKDHARWAARAPARREQKTEMVLWMLTWLENPPLFAQWIKLRRARFVSEM